MATFQEAFRQGAIAGFCTLTAPVERAVQLGEEWYSRRLGAPLAGSPTPLGEALRASRNVLCGIPPDDVSDAFDQGFTGGQCDTNYLVEYSFRETNPQGGVTEGVSTIGVIGPVARGRTEKRGPINPGRRFAIIAYLSTEGGNRDVPIINSSSIPESQGEPVGEYTILSVTRTDGLPDDCGNPPPVPDPYDPSLYDTREDVTYTDPGGNDITIPIGFAYAPIEVNNDFEIEVPIRAQINADVTVDATLNLKSGDVFIDTKNTFGDIVFEPGEEIVVDPTSPPGVVVPPEQQPDNKIIGVVVSVDEVFPGYRGQELTTFNQGTNFYGPRLGSVSFLCQNLGGTGAFWTQDVDVKYNKQIVMCPVPWGAIDVVVTPQLGVSLTFSSINGESDRSLSLRAAGQRGSLTLPGQM